LHGVLALDGSSFPESSDTAVPLLTVANNVTSDDAVSQTTLLHDDEAVTTQTTATERSIADEPFLIADDLRIQSASEQADTVTQVATNDTQEPLLSSNASAFTAETTEASQPEFSINTTIEIEFIEMNTTAHDPSIEGETENENHTANATGNLRLQLCKSELGLGAVSCSINLSPVECRVNFCEQNQRLGVRNYTFQYNTARITIFCAIMLLDSRIFAGLCSLHPTPFMVRMIPRF